MITNFLLSCDISSVIRNWVVLSVCNAFYTSDMMLMVYLLLLFRYYTLPDTRVSRADALSFPAIQLIFVECIAGWTNINVPLPLSWCKVHSEGHYDKGLLPINKSKWTWYLTLQTACFHIWKNILRDKKIKGLLSKK